ncbi:MAG TPA: Ig-like domain-containing protein, partial [Treponemataceae bacterium]|nr:Ig-like domain-containing protein [Treponemataceae bacterium]
MKKIGSVLLPFFAAALAVSCELYPMEPLRVTAWTPDTAVVDTAALEAVSLTFSADVPERLIESSFTLEEDDLPLDGTFVWLDDRTMRFQPHTPFSAHARYRITLATSAEDRDGNSLKEPFV